MKQITAILLVSILGFNLTANADHHEEGFISIFDGKSLKGWDGNPKFWSVKEGAITGQTTAENPTKGNTFVIWRANTVDQFELRLKFKIVGGNSGIQYRSKDLGNWVVGGYQGDFEAGTTYSGILYEEKGRGILAQRGQMTEITTGKDGKHMVNVIGSIGDTKDIQSVIKKEDWNDYKIIARGNHLTHIINGRVTCDVTDSDKSRRQRSGILALQLHAGPPMTVQFKDIRIKPLIGINITGSWQFTVETDQGSGGPSFEFKQREGQLTGDYNGLFGEQPIKGKVQGNQVSFSLTGSYEGQEIESNYTGTITGFNSMKGTLVIGDQFEASWTANRK